MATFSGEQSRCCPILRVCQKYSFPSRILDVTKAFVYSSQHQLPENDKFFCFFFGEDHTSVNYPSMPEVKSDLCHCVSRKFKEANLLLLFKLKFELLFFPFQMERRFRWDKMFFVLFQPKSLRAKRLVVSGVSFPGKRQKKKIEVSWIFCKTHPGTKNKWATCLFLTVFFMKLTSCISTFFKELLCVFSAKQKQWKSASAFRSKLWMRIKFHKALFWKKKMFCKLSPEQKKKLHLLCFFQQQKALRGKKTSSRKSFLLFPSNGENRKGQSKKRIPKTNQT